MILHASMMDMVPTMIMMLKVCNTYHKCIYIYACVCTRKILCKPIVSPVFQLVLVG